MGHPEREGGEGVPAPQGGAGRDITRTQAGLDVFLGCMGCGQGKAWPLTPEFHIMTPPDSWRKEKSSSLSLRQLGTDTLCDPWGGSHRREGSWAQIGMSPGTLKSYGTQDVPPGVTHPNHMWERIFI